MNLNYNSSFFRVIYVIFEILCIAGFFIVSITCLQSAYTHYISGQMVWFLWFAIGGIVLMVISLGGSINFYKRAFQKDHMNIK